MAPSACRGSWRQRCRALQVLRPPGPSVGVKGECRGLGKPDLPWTQCGSPCEGGSGRPEPCHPGDGATKFQQPQTCPDVVICPLGAEWSPNEKRPEWSRGRSVPRPFHSRCCSAKGMLAWGRGGSLPPRSLRGGSGVLGQPQGVLLALTHARNRNSSPPCLVPPFPFILLTAVCPLKYCLAPAMHLLTGLYPSTVRDDEAQTEASSKPLGSTFKEENRGAPGWLSQLKV